MTVIALVGATGPAGYGLAARFARAGHDVAIGSRVPGRAEETRDMVLENVPGAKALAMVNADAVAVGEVVILTMPPNVQRESVERLGSRLDGKIVVSMANPLTVEAGEVKTWFPAAGSLAEEVQQVVPNARVVGAFHEIHVRRFSKLDRRIEADTIVTSDDEDAKAVIMKLARDIEGMRSVDGGPLSNTRFVEGFVAVLISINFRYKAGTALRITGLPEDA